MNDERTKRQQQAIDKACAREKRNERRRRPLHERGRSGAPVDVMPNELRYREQPSEREPAESVEAWMKRTGGAPEQLPQEAMNGEAFPFNNKPRKRA